PASVLAAAQSGDTIGACTRDRRGRNLRDCLNPVHDLSERGVYSKTLRDPMPSDASDTSPVAQTAASPSALFAEVERVFSQERAAHARAVREAKGAPVGRRRKLTTEQVDAAVAQVNAGVSVADVATTSQISRSSMYRLLAERDDAAVGGGA